MHVEPGVSKIQKIIKGEKTKIKVNLSCQN